MARFQTTFALRKYSFLLLFLIAPALLKGAAKESGRADKKVSAGASRFLPKVFRHSSGEISETTPNDDLEELQTDLWTLGKALDRAMKANPEIAAARIALDRQEGAYMQVRASLYPKIDIIGSASQRDPDLIDRAPTRDPFALSQETGIADKNYNLKIQISFIVFDGNKSRNLAAVQRLMKKKLYYDAQNTVYRVAALVEQVFDSLLYRQNLLQIYDNTLDTFASLGKQTTRRYELGEIKELDTLRVQTEMMNAKADYAVALSELAKSEQYFRRILNLPPPRYEGEAIKTEGELAQKQFDLPFSEARELAMKTRSDLLAARTRVEAAEAGVKAAKSQFLPKVNGFADYRVNSSYFDENIRLDGWMVGLSGTWNLFDGGANRGQLLANRSELEAGKLDAEKLENSITSFLHELYAQLSQSRAVVSAQELSVSYGTKGLDQARKMYEIGEASINDVLNAELSLRRSQIKLQEALFKNNSAVSQIRYMIGGPKIAEAPSDIEP